VKSDQLIQIYKNRHVYNIPRYFKLLRIDTNSWHYRLNSKIYGSDIPKNLCPYFWGTILSITILSWLFVLLDLIDRQNWSIPHFNIGLLNFLEKHSIIFRYGLNLGLAGFGGISYFGFGNAGAIFPMAIGISLTIFAIFSKRIFKPGVYKPRHYQEKTPNILIEMAKANHHRICPRLDFVDTQKEDFNDKVRMIDAISTARHKLNDLSENWETPYEVQNKVLNALSEDREQPNEVQSKRLQTQNKASEPS